MGKRWIGKLAATVIVTAFAAPPAAASVFRVTVQARGEVEATGLAVLVADERLLTSHGLVESGDQYLVHDDATGAVLVGSLVERNEDGDLALLSVPSLRGDSVPVALEPSGEGRHVYLWLADDARRQGVMHSVVERSEDPAYRFTALLQEGEAGAPLMNNCNELLAIGRLLERPTREDRLLGQSGDLVSLEEFLTGQGVPFASADERCLSVEEQLAAAEDEQQRLEQDKAALEQAANEAEQENQERLAEIEAEQQALEERLRQQAEELEQRQAQLAEKEEIQRQLEAEQEQQEAATREAEEALAQQQRELQETRRTVWYVGGGLAALLIAVGAFVRSRFRARKRRLDESAEQLAATRESLASATATFHDIVLHGQDLDGEDVRVKINGDALAQAAEGQVIGRSATGSDYVLRSDNVSRRHARLRVEGATVTIEDLGSLNGTRLDGLELTAGEPMPLKDGSSLAFGAVTVVVHFLPED